MWDSVLGHEQNKAFLQRYLQAAERPHALLFCGAPGLGKKHLALQFAKTLLCLHMDGSDGCESCRLLNFEDGNFSHPDFILVQLEEDSKNIKIEQIKELIRQAAFAPVLSQNKACIIDGADKMTADAANSFLKLLEEPPAGWVIILLAAADTALLPTILSRVVKLRFNPVSALQVEEALRQRQIPSEEAAVLARISEGSVGMALTLAEQNLFECRRQVMAFLEALPLQGAFNYLAGFKMPDKEYGQAILFVQVLQTVLRDMLLVKVGRQDGLYNGDLTGQLQELAGGWREQALEQALIAANDAYKALNESAGVKLVLESMALHIDSLRKE